MTGPCAVGVLGLITAAMCLQDLSFPAEIWFRNIPVAVLMVITIPAAVVIL